MATTKPIRDGFHSVTPYLTVRDAGRAIEFYQRAFGAIELGRLTMPDGKIGHAELRLGNSIIMLADEFPEYGNHSPQSLKGATAGFALYVENADTAFSCAIEAGATVKEPVSNKFWGDRAGSVTDPFGHKWTLLTHYEDVSFEEMKTRMAKMFTAGAGQKEGAYSDTTP
ncbi:MAG: VOC family protein [Verrucomicrobiota bacterium]